MGKYIDAIIQLLAYTAYTKMYGIKDRPWEKTEIHLSDRDNDWNSIALNTKTLIDDFADITINDNQSLKISNYHNSWNKTAICLSGCEHK